MTVHSHVEDCERQASGAPLVSWLMCTNREDLHLHGAIRSCLEQSFQDFELIVVVNGSDAVPIAQSLRARYRGNPRMRVMYTATYGLNFSLSLGVHHARAQIIARMDSDDVALPHRLDVQLRYMMAHPRVAVLGSAYQLIDRAGSVIGEVIPPEGSVDIKRRLSIANPICHPTTMLRAAAIREIGGYLGGANAEDFDLWVRIATESDWEFATIPDVLTRYRVESVGHARRSRVAYASMAAAQLRACLVTRSVRWGCGSLLSAGKSVFYSIKP